MNHAHTLLLDDRHANLLTPIVVLWLLVGYLAMRAERAGTYGFAVVAVAAIGAVVMQVTAGLGLFAVQWIIAACIGMAIERRWPRW